MTTNHLTTCRLCSAFCGMVVELDGSTVVGSRGDPEHPISRGYLCPKGRSVAAFHHHPQRLDYPAIDGKRARWDATPDDLTARMKDIVARHEAQAVGYYTANGGAYDSNGRATLASPNMGYVTGQIIEVAGGMSL